MSDGALTIDELIRALERIRKNTEPDLPVLLGDLPLGGDDLVVYDSPVWGVWRLVIGETPKGLSFPNEAARKP